MCAPKLLIYLKITNVNKGIAEYMQHLRTSESFHRKRGIKVKVSNYMLVFREDNKDRNVN